MHFNHAINNPIILDSESLNINYNVEIKPENILITPGGKSTIFISILIFGHENSEIIFPDPGFPIYRSIIKYTIRWPGP